MTSFFTYLLECSALLGLFYSLYLLALRNSTGFNFNRVFLLTALALSFAIPFISWDFNVSKSTVIDESITEISGYRQRYYNAFGDWAFQGTPVEPGNKMIELKKVRTNWAKLALTSLVVVYLIGVLVCLSKIAWSLNWIYRLIRKNERLASAGLQVIKVASPVAPFSFLKYIFVHDELLETPEYEKILSHERIHVHQGHSYDLIFVQLVAAFLWFNPLIWQLIKSLKTTHEYIADKHMIKQGYSLVAYQTLLLSQLISNNSHGLVHNFNLSFIKKRITMMKNNESRWAAKTKMAVVLVSTMIFGIAVAQCNYAMEDQNVRVFDVSSGVSNYNRLARWKNNADILPGDLKHVTKLKILKGQIYLNDESISLDDLASKINKLDPDAQSIVLTKIYANEKMEIVNKVFEKLHESGHRALLLEGRSLNGKQASYLKTLLPPHKNSDDRVPSVSEIVSSGNPYLKLDVSASYEEAKVHEKVTDFVLSNVAQNKDNYVIIIDHKNEDSFQNYIRLKNQTMGAFLKMFDDRSLTKYRKVYFELDPEERKVVRKGIPMAISEHYGYN